MSAKDRTRTVDLARRIQDNAGRAVSNGGEPNYCTEKLDRCLRDAAMALVGLGLSPDDVEQSVRAATNCEVCRQAGW